MQSKWGYLSTSISTLSLLLRHHHLFFNPVPTGSSTHTHTHTHIHTTKWVQMDAANDGWIVFCASPRRVSTMDEGCTNKSLSIRLVRSKNTHTHTLNWLEATVKQKFFSLWFYPFFPLSIMSHGWAFLFAHEIGFFENREDRFRFFLCLPKQWLNIPSRSITFFPRSDFHHQTRSSSLLSSGRPVIIMDTHTHMWEWDRVRR